MKKLAVGLFLLAALPPAAAAGTLELSIRDGLVTLVADEVTVRQILAEWARVGQTQIVNGERIGGSPVTLHLDRVPERQALDTLLRLVPGYLAVPRDTVRADASLYDRILIMPTTSVVAAAPRPPTPNMAGVGGGVFPGPAGGGSVTQLRSPQAAPLSPGLLPEQALVDPSQDPSDDPALAAAAAAGLMPVNALSPLGGSPNALTPPGIVESPAGPVSAPTNPWNAPAGTPQPSLAPPAPASAPPPLTRPRPPVPDR